MENITLGDQIMTLQDGRRLSFKVQGNPDGRPYIFFHGLPGSRLILDGALHLTERDDVLYITPERPGMGLSDNAPKRTFLDWADDVRQLADHLRLERFYLGGISGGGPFVAACAYQMPERIIAAVIISGMGPYNLGVEGMSSGNRQLFFLGKYAPFLLKLLMKLQRSPDMTDPAVREKALKQMAAALPEADVKITQDQDFFNCLMLDQKEANRNGNNGTVREITLNAREWNFRLEDIRLEPISLWHGGQDVNVPIGLAKKVAAAIPNCKAHFFPEEGHLSVIYHHYDQILDELFS